MAARSPIVASGTEGFFQENPIVRGAFVEDEAFKRAFRCTDNPSHAAVNLLTMNSLPPFGDTNGRFERPQ
jgi:hypothetical protein